MHPDVDAALARVRELLRPPPDLKLWEWADQHFQMSAEDGGKWTTHPYQRGIMEALTDPEVERVSVMKSARVGYTKIIEALVLYHMHQDPASMLLVQPTVEDAEGFSKSEIGPAIDRHDFLRGLVSDPKARRKASSGAGNTILAKEFLGRTLWMAGSNSGRGFRRIHARLAIGDEVDAWPASAGKTADGAGEGDPVELAWRRTQEAKLGRKLVLGSTPLDKGASRIEREFLASDQRRYDVPCPHCDHGQHLRWGGAEFDYGFKWPKGEPEGAFYLCEHCHCAIEETEKLWMLEQGIWRAREPFKGHAGFHIWAAYSLSPNATWRHIVSEWLRLHADPVTRKTWVNTWQGESWEQIGRSPSHSRLYQRREKFPALPPVGDAEPVLMVPTGGLVLTSMTDVQNDRLEVGVEAWGVGEENWKLEYHVLYGDPTAEPVWQQLWELLRRSRVAAEGQQVFIRSSCIDSGYAAQSVYAFVRPRPAYRTPDGRLSFLWATKGVPGVGSVWPSKPSKNTIGKSPLYPVKVDTAKDAIAARLELEPPGPGSIHFPTASAFGATYFEQLTAEHAIDDRDRKGFPVREWRLKEGHKRNEPWDVAVGNYAALCALYSVGFSFERESVWLSSSGPMRAQESEDPAALAAPAVHTPSQPPPRREQPRRRPQGWIGGGSNWFRR